MKVLFVIFSTLLFAQVFAQAPPTDIMECFGSVIAEAEQSDREDMREWAIDARLTAQRLREQRQRCDDIPRDDPPTAIQDRMIQACSAAWSASFAFETSRIMSDLQAINPELAAELREQAPQCFGREPATYLRRVLMNVL